MNAFIKKIALALVLVAGIGLVACAPGQKAIEDGGQTLTVNLEYNAGTGYQWFNQFGTNEKDQPLQVVEMATADTSGGGVVGGPLVDTFVLKAANTGKTTMTFYLARAWELGEDADAEDIQEVSVPIEDLPEDTLIITAEATVNEDGTITVDTVEPADYASWFVVE